MKGIPTCSKVQDHRWRDYRWLTMELDKFAKEHPGDISLRDLSQVLQKLGLDDKIALFSEYVQHNDSGTIDISDVLQQLLWNPDNRKEIGYWRGYHQTKNTSPDRQEVQSLKNSRRVRAAKSRSSKNVAKRLF